MVRKNKSPGPEKNNLPAEVVKGVRRDEGRSVGEGELVRTELSVGFVSDNYRLSETEAPRFRGR